MVSSNQPSELDLTLSDLREAGSHATSVSDANPDSKMSGVDRTQSSRSLTGASKGESNAHPALIPKMTELGQCMRKDLPQQCALQGLPYQDEFVLASHQYDPQTHRLESREYTTTDNVIWWVAVGFAIVQGVVVGKYYILPTKATMARMRERRQEEAENDQAFLERLQFLRALQEIQEDEALTDDAPDAPVVRNAAVGDSPRDPGDD